MHRYSKPAASLWPQVGTHSCVYTQIYSCQKHTAVCVCTCIRQVILKQYLLSRIALRLLKIIEPYLAEQERMANAQLLRYGSKHFEQNS